MTDSATADLVTNLPTERERCGYSNVGNVVAKDDNGASRLVLQDRESREYPVPIDLPMDALFPPGRRQERVVESIKAPLVPFDAATSISEKYGLSNKTEVISKATELVFSLPSVGSKMFLITIADRVRRLYPLSLTMSTSMLTRPADCWWTYGARSTRRTMADACGRCRRDTRLLWVRGQDPSW